MTSQTVPLRQMMIHHQLVDIVGEQHVVTQLEDREVYGVDTFWIPRFLVDRGVDLALPDFVVLPGTVDEVKQILKLAQQHRIPVVPWGGGSGSQGGIIPMYGGISLDVKRLNKVIDINEAAGTVTAQGGINGYELETFLNDRGWSLPHLPASIHAATLGGYLAARGSGVLSTKYGKAEQLVLSVEVVLPDGSVMETLPVPNHAAGPGLLQMIVGSEGSLGIITQATMRIERIPEDRRFQAFILPSVGAGLEAGRRIMLDRLDPSVLRLYDEPSTQKVAARTLGLDLDEGAYLVTGFEGWSEISAAQEKRAIDICRDLGAIELGVEPGTTWWDHRYDFYFPPHAFDIPWLFGTVDTVTTFDKMEGLWRAKRDGLESEYAKWNLEYIAHFSHWFPWGVMVYDRFIIHELPADTAEAVQLHNQVWDTSVRITLAEGGVINEHHGVGLKLARFVREQHGAAFKLLEGAKHAVDPGGVLNPGKMGFGPMT